jgi:citrate lyase subunit beta/citryl-CoA lyase
MAALESPKGIMNAYDIVTASPRMFGCAISGGDFRKSMHVQIVRGGIEMLTARGLVLLAARAAGVQCFDTMYPFIDDTEGFEAEVRQNREMGFDGKSIVNPRQIRYVHETFAPTEKEIAYAEKLIRSFNEQADQGVGVYTVDGKMVDIPFFEDARRVLALAQACGVYHGDL